MTVCDITQSSSHNLDHPDDDHDYDHPDDDHDHDHPDDDHHHDHGREAAVELGAPTQIIPAQTGHCLPAILHYTLATIPAILRYTLAGPYQLYCAIH